MAIMDAKLLFSDDQALGAIGSGASTACTDYIDLGARLDCWGSAETADIGNTPGINLDAYLTAVMVGASAVLTATLQMDTVSSFGSPTSLGSVSFPALSAVGTKRSMYVPAGSCERYVRVLYSVAGGSLSAGSTMSAWLGLDFQSA